jgi:hypothetical protein
MHASNDIHYFSSLAGSQLTGGVFTIDASLSLQDKEEGRLKASN